MGYGCSLSFQLSQRQQLENSLEIEVYHEIALSLEFYQEKEKVFTKAYQKALDQGSVYEYKKHGIEFQYALVSKEYLPEGICNQVGHAFAHCLYNAFDAMFCGRKYAMSRGSWLLFVIKDAYSEPLPLKAIELAAVHECGEMITLGDHNKASKLEFAVAKKEGKLTWYMNWIEATCPAKFADVFSYQVHTSMPDDDEIGRILEELQSSASWQEACEIIEGFEWPHRILQRLVKYNDGNEKIEQIIAQVLVVVKEVCVLGSSVKSVMDELEEKSSAVLQEIIDKKLVHYASYPRLQAAWQAMRKNANDEILEYINARKEVISNQEYLEEVLALGKDPGLPKTGAFSTAFDDVIKHLLKK